uniref:Uncharacterized protein n=1 Tax=Brassica campestris TaxID=3711 RepID=M4FJ45_BRACM
MPRAFLLGGRRRADRLDRVDRGRVNAVFQMFRLSCSVGFGLVLSFDVRCVCVGRRYREVDGKVASAIASVQALCTEAISQEASVVSSVEVILNAFKLEILSMVQNALSKHVLEKEATTPPRVTTSKVPSERVRQVPSEKSTLILIRIEIAKFGLRKCKARFQVNRTVVALQSDYDCGYI